MTVARVGFGMRWMTLLLHTGQCVGRPGVLEASPMRRSVGDAAALRNSKRRVAAVPTALHLTNEKPRGADGQHAQSKVLARTHRDHHTGTCLSTILATIPSRPRFAGLARRGKGRAPRCPSRRLPAKQLVTRFSIARGELCRRLLARPRPESCRRTDLGPGEQGPFLPEPMRIRMPRPRCHTARAPDLLMRSTRSP